jgi:hypothetical protein
MVATLVPNKEAVTQARALVDNVITVFGSPGSILTDCASNFTEQCGTYVKLTRNSKINATSFRLQRNASVERSHAVITEYLGHFICHEQNDWDTLLPTAAFVFISGSVPFSGHCPLGSITSSPLSPALPYKNHSSDKRFEQPIHEDNNKISVHLATTSLLVNSKCDAWT